jgi:hypothetical protein
MNLALLRIVNHLDRDELDSMTRPCEGQEHFRFDFEVADSDRDFGPDLKIHEAETASGRPESTNARFIEKD